MELVALLPLCVVLAFGLWQAVVAGHTAWMVSVAARSAARAEAVGGKPEDAARMVLSPRLRDGLRVRVNDDGEVTVRVRIPAVVPGPTLPVVGATARFGAG